jgi:CNT family concentrative nucleoside transporter
MIEMFRSLFGMGAILALAWAFSRHRRQFPFRTVVWGLGLQLAIGILILKTPIGLKIFGLAQKAVLKLNDVSQVGAAMIFGPLASTEQLASVFGPNNTFIFAVSITATIIVVGALSSLLYHWGVLQFMVHWMALIMRRLMGTSGSETLATAANCFVGHTEAPLVIKPYIQKMTQSELMALMTGGMATIAGGVLAVYAQFGRNAGFPELAGHLVTASLMSAPAALVIAKILIPETETSETSATSKLTDTKTSANSIDALCKGARDGGMLALNVMAMVLAFVAIVALANFILQWPQTRMGIVQPISLETIFGWINAPFAWLIGIPWEHCTLVGSMLGERIVLNELFGYLSLTGNREVLDERTFLITSYALCGVANFGSVAVQIGGLSALVPERRSEFARLGLWSMFAGLMACYLTATLVGLLV